MSNNNSPSSDGLTVEFYKMFLPHLSDILFKLYKEIETKESLSHSMKMGVITLLYKKKGDKRCLKNYRPISLLNVDYKIIARVMANRLKFVLPNIISDAQTLQRGATVCKRHYKGCLSRAELKMVKGGRHYNILCDQRETINRESLSDFNFKQERI